MKNLTLFVVLLWSTMSYRDVYSQELFESTLTHLGKDQKEKVDKALRKYEVFTLDFKKINELAKTKKKDIKFKLSISDEYQWDIVLEENEIRAPDYKSVITTDEGEIVQAKEKCHTYKGYLISDSSQYVRLTINENGLEGYVKQKDNFILIQPVGNFSKENSEGAKKKESGVFIAYKSEDILDTLSAQCGVTGAMEKAYLERIGKEESAYSSSRIGDFNFRVIEMATEADGEWFGVHGANSNAAILTVINLIEGVYWNTFQTRMLVTFQHVFNNAATDPFTAAATDGQGIINQLRTEWQNNRAGVERDMVHLFSGRNATVDPLGVAAIVGIRCNEPQNRVDGYAFSKHYANTFFTTAHEIGHLLGGMHDQDAICGTNNRTIMCQGPTTNNFVFSAVSRTAISNYISSNESCLAIRGYIRLSSTNDNHDRICVDRTTRFILAFYSSSSRYTVQWSVGGNLRIIQSNSGSIDVRATNSSTSSGWIEALVSAVNTNDNFVVRRSNIPTGREVNNYTITGPSCVRQGTSDPFAVNAYTTTYNWTVNDGVITSGQNTRIAYIRPTTSNGLYVSVSTTSGGDCGGATGFASQYFTNCSGTYSLSQETIVFPNPTAESLRIESVGQYQIDEVTVIDEVSKIRKRISLDNSKGDIDLSDLEPGIYFVKFALNGVERTERIIVE